jgi:hypothetical protein
MPEQAAKPFGARKKAPDAKGYSIRRVDRPVWNREELIEPHISAASGQIDLPLEPDRRGGNREKRLLAAKLVYAHGDMITDCSVRNISPTGARVEVSQEITLPEFFTVVRLKDRLINEARMVWRRGGEMGIAWTGETINIVDCTEPAHRLIAHRLGLKSAGHTEKNTSETILEY